MYLVILQSLLDNEPQTVPSESIIRNIWAESHTLPATTFHNDKFKNLGTIHHKGLNVLKKITSLSTQNTPQRAMLYEVAYRMILSHATWLDENLIKHICILSDILKAWAECNKDPSDSILPTFERLLDQVGAPTDALSYEIIMNSYLVQAFFAAKSDLSDKSLIYYNRALDILNLNSQELQELKINYVYNYSLKIALELCSKGYDCAVRWLNNTVRRLKECNVSVQNRNLLSPIVVPIKCHIQEWRREFRVLRNQVSKTVQEVVRVLHYVRVTSYLNELVTKNANQDDFQKRVLEDLCVINYSSFISSRQENGRLGHSCTSLRWYPAHSCVVYRLKDSYLTNQIYLTIKRK
ncbi:hypothetical protein K501DRAFT_278071 [Backusella circina FSU 941]|nr:hypothetical protein K501DRAFT_278071 [Backusella circina FSU 941]